MSVAKDSKKKIAIFEAPLGIGGVGLALVNMLDQFDYEKYEVTLWLENDTGLLQPAVNEHVIIRYWGGEDPGYSKILCGKLKHGHFLWCIKSIFYRILSKINVNDYYKNYKYFLQSLPKFSKEIYDCMIIYHGLVRDRVMIASHRFNYRKKAAWIHGRCSHKRDEDYFKPFFAEYGKMDKLFCVSKATKEIFNGVYPELSDKTDVFYNLMNENVIIQKSKEEIVKPFDGITFVTVGRLSQEKGQDMIPKTARLLLDAGYRFKWYLLGEGTTKELIEQEIKKYRVEANVFLLGKLNNPYPYIKMCTVYVQPSYSEGYCTSTLEAKVLCKPVVTTDAPGMREQFVNGENGIIVGEMTAEALFDGIMTLMEQPRLMDQIVQKLSAGENNNVQEMRKLYSLISGE